MIASLTAFALRATSGNGSCARAWITFQIWVRCSYAGRVLKSFLDCVSLREEQARTGDLPKGETVYSLHNCVILAACKSNEVLPMNPKFPADIFTACLTTPIKMALRWFIHRNSLTTLTEDLVDQVPGTESDKKSMLGELTSIFVTVTDSIAWNVLPNDVFAQLLRAELFVGTLVRNFLLASRIMSSMGCTPVSYPHIPDVHNHSLWDSWDLAVEKCLLELVKLSRKKTEALNAVEIVRPTNPPMVNANFFAENLTAFSVWLELGSFSSPPPMRLPVILQVLLSPLYRMKALMLLARFMQKGPWAVNMALSIGLFPYMLRLITTAYTTPGGADMREVFRHIHIFLSILIFLPFSLSLLYSHKKERDRERKREKRIRLGVVPSLWELACGYWWAASGDVGSSRCLSSQMSQSRLTCRTRITQCISKSATRPSKGR